MEECEGILSNIKVDWLLSNYTSIVQPINQGVGNVLRIGPEVLHEHLAKMLYLQQEPIRRSQRINSMLKERKIIQFSNNVEHYPGASRSWVH